jgi:nucleoside-diphosphate-sugar epimerase
LHCTNVGGSERVLRAVADVRVPVLVYASAVGTYALVRSIPGESRACSMRDRYRRRHVR